MAINFYFANQIEILFHKFIQELNNNKNKDPFYSQVILAPNVNLRKWLQLNIARINNISINYNFMFLEEGLAHVIKKISDSQKENKDRFLFLSHKENHIYLQLFVLFLIFTSQNNNDLTALYDYLKTSGKKDYARKTWQLSERLTYYFREYEYHRKDMINNWLNDIKNFSQNHYLNKIEGFQKELYRKIFYEEKIKKEFKETTDKEYITLPQYADKYLKKEKNNLMKNILPEETIYIFGFSQISKFHYELIFNLRDYYNIKVFQLNFFETPISKIGEHGNNELLESWGKPLKESIEILDDFKKKDKNNSTIVLHQNKINLSKPTLLNLLQNDILNNSLFDINIKKLDEQDTSIQIIACPGIYREVESVYNNIIENLNNNKSLKLTDIAILVYDMEKYINIIKSVLEHKPDINFGSIEEINNKPHIPFNLSDSNAYLESIFGGALIKGLELANGKFSRKEVFDFILNPCFLKSQNLTRNDISIWLTWIEKLNVFFGYDENDKKKTSNSNNDIFTWSNGLKRLRLGRIMKDYAFEGKAKNFQKLIPYSDLNTQDQMQLNKFIGILEHLFSFLTSLQEKKKVKEWIESIKYFIDSFLSVPEDTPSEKYVLYKIIEDINKLEIFDKLFKDKMELDYIIEFIKSHLSNIPTKFGRYLSDGITISSFMPARPIPFKIIYIIGMNENEFPGFKDYSTLDLRNTARITGDVSKPEANNYLFLETLLSVREKLYITYISKDLQKDEKLYPSPTCTKLMNYINNNLIKNSFKTVEIPLKGESIKYFNEQSLFHDAIKNYNYSERLLGFLSLKNKYNFNNKELMEIEDKYKKTQDLLNEKNAEIFNRDIEAVTINDLYNFIMNPAEAQIKKIFEIYDEDETDQSIKEDEPFYTPFPNDHKIIMDCLNNYIKNIITDNDFSFDEYFNELYSHNQMLGNTPEAIYQKIDKANIHSRINERIYNEKYGLDNHIKMGLKNAFYERIIINSDYSSNNAILAFPSLMLELKAGNEKKVITLTGELENMISDKEESYLTSIIITNSKKIKKNRIIKPLLFYLFLLCGNKKNDKNITSNDFINNKKFKIKVFCREEIREYELKIDKEEAYQYIKSLLMDFISLSNFDYLPFEIIIDNKDLFPLKEKNNYDVKLIKAVENKLDSSYSDFKESGVFELVKREVPPDAFNKIKKRYKYFSMILNKEENLY